MVNKGEGCRRCFLLPFEYRYVKIYLLSMMNLGGIFRGN